MKNAQVQSNIEVIPESIVRLEKERKMLKFATLWLKFSLNCKKNSVSSSITMKKIFSLYLWRLNTIYDPKIIDEIK